MTDAAPVIKELKANNIVVLRNHGVVAMGPDLFRAFVLIQELEEQLKIDSGCMFIIKQGWPGEYANQGTGPAEQTGKRNAEKVQTFFQRTNRRNCPFSQ